MVFPLIYCVRFIIPTEQMDEGLLGRQRQYEGWILNLSRELNHYKAANVELNNKLRELCGSSTQPKEHPKGAKVFIFSVWLRCHSAGQGTRCL